MVMRERTTSVFNYAICGLGNTEPEPYRPMIQLFFELGLSSWAQIPFQFGLHAGDGQSSKVLMFWSKTCRSPAAVCSPRALSQPLFSTLYPRPKPRPELLRAKNRRREWERTEWGSGSGRQWVPWTQVQISVLLFLRCSIDGKLFNFFELQFIHSF